MKNETFQLQQQQDALAAISGIDKARVLSIVEALATNPAVIEAIDFDISLYPDKAGKVLSRIAIAALEAVDGHFEEGKRSD